jgi:hypothetical protein
MAHPSCRLCWKLWKSYCQLPCKSLQCWIQHESSMSSVLFLKKPSSHTLLYRYIKLLLKAHICSRQTLLILVPSMELLQHTVPGASTTCKELLDGDECRHYIFSWSSLVKYKTSVSGTTCVMLMYYLSDMNGIFVGPNLSYIHTSVAHVAVINF